MLADCDAKIQRIVIRHAIYQELIIAVFSELALAPVLRHPYTDFLFAATRRRDHVLLLVIVEECFRVVKRKRRAVWMGEVVSILVRISF